MIIINEFIYRIKLYQLCEYSQTVINRGPVNYQHKNYELYTYLN